MFYWTAKGFSKYDYSDALVTQKPVFDVVQVSLTYFHVDDCYGHQIRFNEMIFPWDC